MNRFVWSLLPVLVMACATEVTDLDCPEDGCRAAPTTLALSVDELDFGLVAAVCPTERMFEVSNPTDVPLTFSARQGGVLPRTMSFDPAGPVVIPPGVTRTVLVKLSPNDPDGLEIVVQLCDEGCEQVVPITVDLAHPPVTCEDIDFGEVPVGTCVDREFSCPNVTIAEVDVSIYSGGSPFRVSPDYARVDGLGQYTGTLTFCPEGVDAVMQTVEAVIAPVCAKPALVDWGFSPLLVARGRGI